MPRTRPPAWWDDDAEFARYSAGWTCRPRLDEEAARRGVSARVLMLRLVAAYFAREGRRHPRHARDGGTRPARGK